LDPANLSTRQPELIWPDHGANNRSPVEYFYLFFSMMCVAQTLILTSAELTKLGRPALTEQEFFQYIGVMLITSLYKHMPLDELFKGTGEGYEFDASPEIGKYMSKSRFEYINRCLTFAKPCETAGPRWPACRIGGAITTTVPRTTLQ
jgi:hypothetical protein